MTLALQHPNQIDYRSAESFRFAKEIQKKFGDLDQVLSWCRSELTGEWRWQMMDFAMPNSLNRYIFYFDNSKDALAFELKWS